ncbi:MAG: hypothetical protein ACSLE6_08180 [Mycobacterium sp.]
MTRLAHLQALIDDYEFLAFDIALDGGFTMVGPKEPGRYDEIIAGYLGAVTAKDSPWKVLLYLVLGIGAQLLFVAVATLVVTKVHALWRRRRESPEPEDAEPLTLVKTPSDTTG